MSLCRPFGPLVIEGEVFPDLTDGAIEFRSFGPNACRIKTESVWASLICGLLVAIEDVRRPFRDARRWFVARG